MTQLDHAQRVLVREGFQTGTTELAGQVVLTAQKRTFRLLWFATAIWENIVVFRVNNLDDERLRTFVQAAKSWAMNEKRGLPRGLQSGQAILVVVLATSVSPAAVKLARRTWHTEFGRFVAAGLSDGRVKTLPTRRALIGLVYRSHLLGRLSTVLDAHESNP